MLEEMEEQWAAFIAAGNKNEVSLGDDEKRVLIRDWHDRTCTEPRWLDDTQHFRSQRRWIERTCLCSGSNFPDDDHGRFVHLNQLLQTLFGLDAMINHEIMSKDLTFFLPDSYREGFDIDVPCCNTICYLVPASGRNVPKYDNPSLGVGREAYRSTISLPMLALTDSLQSRFTAVMRVLDLRPHYHLTDLSDLVMPSVDKSIHDICMNELPGCPYPDTSHWSVKAGKLEGFLKEQNRKLAEQTWPQFMIISASQAVIPNACMRT
ncbi:hypothetical protein BDV96DRAFT_647345 [Lophiotrema nucula]|uniref:Uncharacterized protein n=1 Tax=Lophiotrema nucula TaxID=690887 RepID=A0A6A5Z5C9_9PLEO|nr:hypothetical protein BDV96DRAFT_647345 [Lophiotrema nucula]